MEVSGGGGRGSQCSTELVFGLGDYTGGTLQLKVDWPDGASQTVMADTTATNLLVDTQSPELVVSTVGVQVAAAGPGLSEWSFSWQTHYASNVQLDKVFVTPQGNCGSPMTLQNGTPGVRIYVSRLASGNFLHTLVADQMGCTPGCSYSYYCQSATDAVVSNHQASPKTFKTKICAQ